MSRWISVSPSRVNRISAVLDIEEVAENRLVNINEFREKLFHRRGNPLDFMGYFDKNRCESGVNKFSLNVRFVRLAGTVIFG